MKTILITGASGSVASSLARLLSAQGWSLVLASRGEDVERSATTHLVNVDVSTEAGAQAAVEAASKHFGSAPSALVHCAGSVLIAPMGRTSEAQYRAVMAANLDSAFFIGKAYASAVARAGQPASLVFFSSVVAGIGVANHAAIAAAKGGVEALARSMAADYSGIGLRVNCIAPGLIRGPATERMFGNPAGARQAGAQYPLGRHGEAADAASLAAFLASDESSWITGQVIGLDGGFKAVRPLVRAAG